jgi:low affinity Fe/Cu permease
MSFAEYISLASPSRMHRVAALMSNESWSERFARRATTWSGSSLAFAIAVSSVLIWLITGPIFHYSDTWQLVINTGTTVVTFLMVFLIQRAQNKDSLAVQLKLNEIVAALDGASNRLINVEDLAEQDVQVLHQHFEKLSELAAAETSLTNSHSIEEAEGRHAKKHKSTATTKKVPAVSQ